MMAQATDPLRDIALYVVATAALSAVALWVDTGNAWLNLALRTALLLLLVALVMRRENLAPMLARIPVVGRLFRSAARELR